MLVKKCTSVVVSQLSRSGESKSGFCLNGIRLKRRHMNLSTINHGEKPLGRGVTAFEVVQNGGELLGKIKANVLKMFGGQNKGVKSVDAIIAGGHVDGAILTRRLDTSSTVLSHPVRVKETADLHLTSVESDLNAKKLFASESFFKQGTVVSAQALNIASSSLDGVIQVAENAKLMDSKVTDSFTSRNLLIDNAVFGHFSYAKIANKTFVGGVKMGGTFMTNSLTSSSGVNALESSSVLIAKNVSLLGDSSNIFNGKSTILEDLYTSGANVVFGKTSKTVVNGVARLNSRQIVLNGDFSGKIVALGPNAVIGESARFDSNARKSLPWRLNTLAAKMLPSHRLPKDY